jgi:26S proteasome regulatory subunit N2
VTKVATAILSTTAKAKAKAKKDAEAKKEAEGVKAAAAAAAEAMETGDGEKKPEDAEKEGKKKVEEALSETLKNPARVVPSQEKHVVFQQGLGVRYVPIKQVSSGIVLLKDMNPELPVELVEVSTVGTAAAAATGTAAAAAAAPTPVEEDEPLPPPAFEFVPPS